MRDIGNKRDEDQGFKMVIHDSSVLSMILKQYIPEFRNMDIEDIKDCLNLTENRDYVIGRDTEFPSKKEGPIRVDSIFDIKLPGGKDTSIIVGIESQTRIGDRKRLLKRMCYYGCRIVSAQKRVEFSNDSYEDMKDVICIWLLLNPTREFRNDVKRLTLKGGSILHDDMNGIEIDSLSVIIVGLDYSDDANSDVRFVSDLFYPDLTDEQRFELIEKNYNIRLSKSVLEGVDSVMSFGEESIRAERYEERMENDMKHAKSLARPLYEYMMEKNLTLDQTLDHFNATGDFSRNPRFLILHNVVPYF